MSSFAQTHEAFQDFLCLFQQEVASSAGELLLSLSYLPAANRLGVVVMKARGLQSDKLKDNIGIYTLLLTTLKSR